MSVAKRLWKVLRAELGVRGRDPSPPRGASSDVEWGGAVGPEVTGAVAAAAPRIDPVLAGYYANLEVPYGADLATVRVAWKRLLQRVHPDRHANAAERSAVATEVTKKLNHAYTQLRRHLAAESTA